VQPQFFGARHLRDAGEGIESRGGGAATGSNDGAGFASRGPVTDDGGLQFIRPQVEVLVDRDHAHVVAAEPGQQRGFFHRAVRLRGGVDHQRVFLRLQAAARGGVVRGAFTRAHQGNERGIGGRVLDDSGPTVTEAQHLPPPVQANLFEFRERGTGLPVEAELPESGADQVAEHGGIQTIGREVAMETRILPMRAGRQDQRIEIAADVGEWFSCLRRRGRQRRAQRARGVARNHGEGALRDALAIVGYPVDELVTGAAELVGSHGGCRSPGGVAAQTGPAF
jgi:hypothetical protein